MTLESFRHENVGGQGKKIRRNISHENSAKKFIYHFLGGINVAYVRLNLGGNNQAEEWQDI